MANSTIRANCCPTVRTGRSSGGPRYTGCHVGWQRLSAGIPPTTRRPAPGLSDARSHRLTSRLLLGAVEPVIAAVDPGLTATASTLQAVLRRTDAFLAASFSAAIASSISLFGLLLASMGIYSTVSYDVVLRTREIGSAWRSALRRAMYWP